MFLENDTLTVSKESIKKYGATGAVILQVLYSEYGYNIPLKTESWCKQYGILEFIQIEIVKRTLNKLESNGFIKIEDNFIFIPQDNKKLKVEPKEKKEPKERKENPAWEMALVLMEAYGEDHNLFSAKRHLKFANKLLNFNVTKEDIKRLYIGETSWWYTSTFSGQHGNNPNQISLGKTIKDAMNNVSQIQVKQDSKADFWT